MKLCIAVLLIIAAVAQEQSRGQQVYRQEQEIRTQNKMSYNNLRSYNFVAGKYDDFILRPQSDSQVKFEAHVYWKQDNVYVSAQYREGEDIKANVYENGRIVLVEQAFYTTTGFTFQAKKGLTYTVRFQNTGNVSKLVSMLMSMPLQVSQSVATKEHLNPAQDKIERIGHEMKAMMTISQRNFLFKDQLANKILSSSQLYMAYQILEVILIIGVTVFQVASLTKLLKGSGIV